MQSELSKLDTNTVFSLQDLSFNQEQLFIFLGILLSALILGFLLGYLIRSLKSNRQVSTEREQRITLEARLKNQDALDTERDTALALARERLENAFNDLAHDSLEKNSNVFLQLAEQKLGGQQLHASNELEQRKEAINTLLKPIGEAIQKTENQIGQIEKDRQRSFGELDQRLSELKNTQVDLASETRNLVNALRKPEVRGRWGEQSLRRLVELSGMVAHCDFDEQVSVQADVGRLRPDMVVHLPDERQLIIDAKAPLQAYLDALEAKDPETQQQHLQRHLKTIKTHIKQLASKDYWMSFKQAPEFVILFIPGEQFLAAAMDLDHDLFEFALKQNIILATPNNLMALLKTVNYGWKQVHLARNAENIKDIAETLYKRLTTFTEHLQKMGRSLEQTSKAYNQAVGSMERNVLPGVRKFKDMGISATKDMGALEEVQTALRIPNNPKE